MAERPQARYSEDGQALARRAGFPPGYRNARTSMSHSARRPPLPSSSAITMALIALTTLRARLILAPMASVEAVRPLRVEALRPVDASSASAAAAKRSRKS